MIAVHLSPGPKGYGVIRDDGSLIATGMTWQRAVLTVNGGEGLEKYGNSRIGGGDYRGRRIPHRTFSHNEAQSPEDFMS